MLPLEDKNYDAISSNQHFEPDITIHEKFPNSVVINKSHPIDRLKQELLEKCNLQPHLDRTYYIPDLSNSLLKGSIVAFCQICKKDHNQDHTISGISLINVSSNFNCHIKVMFTV